MTYKLRSIVPSESDIQSAIIGALVYQQAAGRVVWFGRFNSGSAPLTGKGGRRQWVTFLTYWLKPGHKRTKGYPDIAGMLTDGRPLYLECKRPGGKIREEQAEFIERVSLYGAAVGIVDSVDEAINVIMG